LEMPIGGFCLLVGAWP